MTWEASEQRARMVEAYQERLHLRNRRGEWTNMPGGPVKSLWGQALGELNQHPGGPTGLPKASSLPRVTVKKRDGGEVPGLEVLPGVALTSFHGLVRPRAFGKQRTLNRDSGWGAVHIASGLPIGNETMKGDVESVTQIVRGALGHLDWTAPDPKSLAGSATHRRAGVVLDHAMRRARVNRNAVTDTPERELDVAALGDIRARGAAMEVGAITQSKELLANGRAVAAGLREMRRFGPMRDRFQDGTADVDDHLRALEIMQGTPVAEKIVAGLRMLDQMKGGHIVTHAAVDPTPPRPRPKRREAQREPLSGPLAAPIPEGMKWKPQPIDVKTIAARRAERTEYRGFKVGQRVELKTATQGRHEGAQVGELVGFEPRDGGARFVAKVRFDSGLERTFHPAHLVPEGRQSEAITLKSMTRRDRPPPGFMRAFAQTAAERRAATVTMVGHKLWQVDVGGGRKVLVNADSAADAKRQASREHSLR